MKRRSLALFLAVLMAFGSVLPVFAVEPEATEAVAEEKQETTLTYEDLYVPGAIFTWDASDKTEADVVDFGEGTSIVLAEKGDMKLTLTKPSDGTAVYGNGYLEVTDTKDGAQLKLANVYTKVPTVTDEAYAYTSSITMALLPFQGSTTPVGFKQDYMAFAASNVYMLHSYAMTESAAFIDDADAALHNAWSQAYLAAKNDASLQATFRTPIAKEHYDTLHAKDEYKDHVFTVEVGSEGVADYSISGYEADWTAFSYIMKDSSRYYVIDNNGANSPQLFNNGIAKTVFNTGTWIADCDWKDTVGSVWTANAKYETATQTRINTAKKTASGYNYASKIYVDTRKALTGTKDHTNAPGVVGASGSGTNMQFAAGLDARFYGIRIYEKALSDVELAQNHFADLCKINQVDLAKIEALSDEDRATLVNLCSGLRFADTDAATIDAKIQEIALEKLYAAMYVQNGLMYRWDAYGMNEFFGSQTLIMADKDGRDKSLTLNGVSYNSTYKVPETTNPINFTSLVARDKNGAYLEDELEFELVMLTTSFEWNPSTNNAYIGPRPYFDLGPIDIPNSGEREVVKDGVENESRGGYGGFWVGIRNTTAEKTAYYFDANGNKTDAANAVNTVNVPFLTKTTTFTTQSYSTPKRYFGNYEGHSYSIGGALKFETLEATAGAVHLTLYRDTYSVKQLNNISYVHGKSAYGTATKVEPANYEEALIMEGRNAGLNGSFANADDGVFKVAGAQPESSGTLKLGYHAFRLYNRALTADERMQNHFADLCIYHRVDFDTISAYMALTADQQKEIYAQSQFTAAKVDSFTEASNKSFEDVSAKQIKEAVDAIVEKYKEQTYQNALSLMNEGKYEEAKAIFASLGDYEDAASKIEECDQLQKEQAEKEQKDKLFAAMYVQDGLMYRWDAYTGVSVFAGEATLADKNGGDVALKINNTSYDADKKYLIANTNPLNFSALIERDDDGAYVEDEIEFELVMTQTSWNGTEHGDNRPYMAFGPLDNVGSGKTHTKDGKGDPKSFGGYPCFYYAYRNPAVSTTETVTYYFDADGNRVDAAVEGGKSVNVTYAKQMANVQINTENWGAARYFGNPVGESYSVGANMKFNVAADGVGTMNLALIRDRQIIMKDNGGAAQQYVISYVPGLTSQALATEKIDGVTYVAQSTRIIPANLAEAEAMAATGYVALNHKLTADPGVFKIGGARSTNLSVAYYAFRLYNRTLTDMERAQNHFADLCAYHQVDLTVFNKLSAENKQELYLAYNAAVIDSRDKAENTSFEDVDKPQLEAAINEVFVQAEVINKYQNAIALMGEGKYEEAKALLEVVGDYEDAPAMLAECNVRITLHKYGYVDGYTTFFSAYGANGSSDGVISLGAAPTVSGGTSAYSDGYLRAVGSKLTIANAYVAPASGEKLSYTTEFIYAGYDSGRTWSGENVTFGTIDSPAFATDTKSTFSTIGFKETARFVDEESMAWHKAWSEAYAAAEKDEALKAAYWTPIAEADYNALVDAGMTANVRTVTVGGEGVAAYSQTGYEANWDGFQKVLATKTQFYQGFDYVSKGYEGVYNLKIMKNDWRGVAGGWMAQFDYIGDFGPEKGSWSSYDFGVVTSHTWIENVDTDVTTAGKKTVKVDVYNETRRIGNKSYTASGTSDFNTAFTMENFDADIYAIRIYPFALSAEQRAQNHFADLASYYGIDNVEAFDSLNDESKAALYDAFASVMVKDTSKTALENAITAAALKEEYNVTVTVEDYIHFEGYEIRLHDYAGLRSVYSVNKNVVKEGVVTLKEVGAIMAIADGRTVDELTVAKNEAGAYVVTGKNMANTAIFAGGAWDEDKNDGDGALYKKGEQFRFAYTCTFEGEGNMTDAGKLTTELLFRGYVVLEIDGQDYVLYTDMTAPSYEKISMYDVSKVFEKEFIENGKDTPQTVKDVLEACKK